MVYVIGIFTGPISGRISNRFGSGNTLLGGAAVLAAALALILLPAIPAIIAGLLMLCAGFFAIHSAAVGSLNRKLESGQGRANALYVLFYYLGGWIGITGAGLIYERHGWPAVVGMCLVLLIIPISTGIGEKRHSPGQVR
jgi:YNFM family putative membrane transporter